MDISSFKTPKKSLGDLNAEAAARLIAAAGDVALIVDREGVIRDLAFGNEELSQEGYAGWLGLPWIETVTIESRPKVEALLRDASADGSPRWRQVNHPSAHGSDVPVLYSAIQVGEEGRIVAVGRDLRAMARLQQRLVEAQQSMERDYSRLRHAETRYRLLFQIASEAVLVVDAESQRIVEANPAAVQLLGGDDKGIAGRTFPFGIQPDSVTAVDELLIRARSSGHADGVQARLAHGGQRAFSLSASLFRQDSNTYWLVRIAAADRDASAAVVPKAKSRLLDVVEGLPDGFVVTSLDGRVLTSNRAFLDLAQLATEEQARGQSLERWLGRPGVDFHVLLANLRQHGVVRLFATALRGEYGSRSDVEISAVAVPAGMQPCLGFTVRSVGRRLTEPRATRELPRSIEQVTELIGRVPLKELVRETTDVIERMCIEAALELTHDNRASAAEMLGLSRQSLYVKLRRFNMVEASDDEDSRT